MRVELIFTEVARVTETYEVDALPDGWAGMSMAERAEWLDDADHTLVDRDSDWVGPTVLEAVDVA